MDIALPDRTTFSPHPRPLLPLSLGRWVPYSVTTIQKPSLQIEGYFKPSYVEVSTCTSIYLSYGDRHSLRGIFDHKGEGREEVYLGGESDPRTVRLYGAHRRSAPHGNMPFLQVE
jgi:hypothetical protein